MKDKGNSLIYIASQNDRNGNPRRGWIHCTWDGDFIEFIDEGYEGKSAIEHLVKYGIKQINPYRIQVAPSEYNRWKKLKTEGGK